VFANRLPCGSPPTSLKESFPETYDPATLLSRDAIFVKLKIGEREQKLNWVKVY